MMAQYVSLKERYSDCVLLFRLGDFYEAFNEDARYVSKYLGLVLTHRNETPMAGMPHHAVDVYVKKLVELGNKVAICDQLEDPSEAKGIVKRDVTRVITPGTLITDNTLTAENNYIAAVYNKTIAFIDISTGDFFVEGSLDSIDRYKPRHMIHNGDFKTNGDLLNEKVEDWYFDPKNAERTIGEHFDLKDVSFLELTKDETVVCSALLKYLQITQKRVLKHIRFPLKTRDGERSFLDSSTISNLEIIDSESGLSLYSHMRKTVTRMGQRLLKRELVSPLVKKEEILKRHGLVETLVNDPKRLMALRETLSKIHDIERILSRVAYPAATPSDLVALRESLEGFENLNGWIDSNGIFEEERLELLDGLRALLIRAIKEDPIGDVGNGNVVREGFSKDLDEARSILSDVDVYLQKYREKERERLGVKVKVGYSSVFGYYVEVSKTFRGNLPEEYTRKQTLVNSERYTTPELTEIEDKVLHANEKVKEMELGIFEGVCGEILKEKRNLTQDASKVAFMDMVSSFAKIALDEGYTRPEFGKNVEIEKGRHPIIEKRVNEFIPNDLEMNGKKRFIILTGPNMSGKSTFIRQIAIISLMAQIGSFVPAKKAKLKIFDRIFTRIGARDDLASNRSTFLVEMSEVATILHSATSESLIILDEVGRGTSTFDGLSIAWSVSEYISQEVRAFTIFATHYNELSELEKMYSGFVNLTIKVVERDDRVLFLHRVVDGSADRSYGIEVARIAGVPIAVVDRAYQVAEALSSASQIEKGVRFLTTGEVENLRRKLKNVNKDQTSFL